MFWQRIYGLRFIHLIDLLLLHFIWGPKSAESWHLRKCIYILHSPSHVSVEDVLFDLRTVSICIVIAYEHPACTVFVDTLHRHLLHCKWVVFGDQYCVENFFSNFNSLYPCKCFKRRVYFPRVKLIVSTLHFLLRSVDVELGN